MADPRSPVVKPFYYLATVIWYIFTVIQVLLLFRVGLRLIGANPNAEFTQFMYGITGGLVDPFVRIVSPTPVGPGVIEWSSIIAIAVYWFLAWVIVRLFLIARPVSNGEAAMHLEEMDGSDPSLTATGRDDHQYVDGPGYHGPERRHYTRRA